MTETLAFLACLICLRLKKSYCDLAEEDTPERRERKTKSLHMSLKHTSFLSVLFSIFALMLFSLFAVDTAYSLSTAWALLAVFAAVVVIFIISPALKPGGFEKKLAAALSPIPAYFLQKLERPVIWSEKQFAHISARFNKPKPLSKKALKDLLKKQQSLASEDIKADLKLALAGLDLNTQKSEYFMQKLQKIKKVKTQEEVGPVLLSELHATGRKVFPAEDGAEILGVIRLDKLTDLKAGGKAVEALDPQMVIVNKDEPVLNVIKRFIDSSAELVFAEDDEGKLKGVIYLEDVLRELI